MNMKALPFTFAATSPHGYSSYAPGYVAATARSAAAFRSIVLSFAFAIASSARLPAFTSNQRSHPRTTSSLPWSTR